MGIVTMRIDDLIHEHLSTLKSTQWGKTTMRDLSAKLLEEKIEEEFAKYVEDLTRKGDGSDGDL